MTVTIRPGGPGDATEIGDIRNQGIVDRVATLDTDLLSRDGSRMFMEQHGPRHPFIVADADGKVVGWASLNPFNPRKAYEHVADFSVYIDRAWRGKGVGSLLLDRLIRIGRELGYHKLVLSALARNEAGISLYAKFGFSRVGVYREMGLIDGEWVDVVIMEKLL
jgi:L-amino acid N-acyltransferase YncA